MAGKVYIELVTHKLPGLSAAYGGGIGGTAGAPTPNVNSAKARITRITNLLVAMLAGVYRGVFRIRADDSPGVSATLAVTVKQADTIAGDYLAIQAPGQMPIILTAITSGTQNPGDGTYKAITDDATTATNLAFAINTSLLCQNAGLTASAASAIVTITAKAGSAGNSITATKVVGTSDALTFTSPFSGGHDSGASAPAVTFTISAAVTADDTVTLGSVVLTAKASPSGESQWAGGVSQDADGAALAACINAHSKLQGIFTASYGAASSGIVTINFVPTGRICYQTVLAKSCSVGTLSATTFAPPTVDTYATSMVEYDMGGTPA